MKQVENLHKIVKEMVDLTSSEDLNANGNLSEESLVSVRLFRKCQS